MNGSSLTTYKASAAGNPSALEPGTAKGEAVQIWQEQFEYLISHGIAYQTKTCRPDCPDCARLGRLTQILLEPFRSEQHF